MDAVPGYRALDGCLLCAQLFCGGTVQHEDHSEDEDH